jgi:hypothetical protein
MRFWTRAVIYGIIMGTFGHVIGVRGWQLAAIIITDAILTPLLDAAIPRVKK